MKHEKNSICSLPCYFCPAERYFLSDLNIFSAATYADEYVGKKMLLEWLTYILQFLPLRHIPRYPHRTNNRTRTIIPGHLRY